MAKRYLTRLQTKLQNQKKRKYTHNTYSDISQINDHIYIGNKHVAANINQLQEHGITHVVNCAEELEYIVQSYDETMNWLFLPMIDCRYEGNVVDYIPQAIEFIDLAITNNHKVLIHCAAGISRSGAVGLFCCRYFDLDQKEFRRLNSQITPNLHVLNVLNKESGIDDDYIKFWSKLCIRKDVTKRIKFI